MSTKGEDSGSERKTQKKKTRSKKRDVTEEQAQQPATIEGAAKHLGPVQSQPDPKLQSAQITGSWLPPDYESLAISWKLLKLLDGAESYMFSFSVKLFLKNDLVLDTALNADHFLVPFSVAEDPARVSRHLISGQFNYETKALTETKALSPDQEFEPIQPILSVSHLTYPGCSDGISVQLYSAG